MSADRWSRSSSVRSWSTSGVDGDTGRTTKLQLPVSPLAEVNSYERSASSRARYYASSSRGSALQSTASLEPSNSSGSSGLLVYHANSVQYDSATSEDSSTSRPSSDHEQIITRRPRPRARSHVTRWRRLWCTCRKRIPRGYGSVLVFILNVIESFAFYGAIDGTLKIVFNDPSWHGIALTLLVKFTAGRILYPIAGFISDVYSGRYKMIQIGIGLFWVAFALLSLSLSLAAGEIGSEKVNTLIIPIAAFVLICAGSGAIEVVIIPFGVDQLSQGASSQEQSSYFYWYYFGRQLGNLLGILSFYTLSQLRIEADDEQNKYAAMSIQAVVGLAGMTVALVLMWCFKSVLFQDRQRENPLKEVANILFYAATVKDTPPVSRRAFRYGESRKRRIERAKSRYDGIYTSEEVEDVKTFCKILLVVFSLGLCFMTYTGVYVMLEYQLSNVYKVKPDFFYLPPNVFSLWNAVTLMMALPIMNFVVLPCTPSSTMRERIGFGVSLIILSAVLSTYVEWCVLPDVSRENKFLWLVLPTVCVSLGEVMLFVTGLEFIYAQSPEQMKGLLTGLFYLIFGLFSGSATLFFYFYPIQFNQLHNHVWYFIIYSVVGGVGFSMYVIVACLYSNRDRPEEELYD